jgi:hypothetical protein
MGAIAFFFLLFEGATLIGTSPMFLGTLGAPE